MRGKTHATIAARTGAEPHTTQLGGQLLFRRAVRRARFANDPQTAALAARRTAPAVPAGTRFDHAEVVEVRRLESDSAASTAGLERGVLRIHRGVTLSAATAHQTAHRKSPRGFQRDVRRVRACVQQINICGNQFAIDDEQFGRAQDGVVGHPHNHPRRDTDHAGFDRATQLLFVFEHDFAAHGPADGSRGLRRGSSRPTQSDHRNDSGQPESDRAMAQENELSNDLHDFMPEWKRARAQ